MSDYTQSVFYGPKDALATGNPLKLIRGVEIDVEYAAISTAIASKADVSGDSILFADGTAGAPPITFASDTNTGFYRIGVDSLGITAGGATRLRLQSAAEVLSLTASGVTGNTYLSFYESNAFTARKGYVGYGGAADDSLYIANEENADIVFFTNATLRWLINAAGTLSSSGPVVTVFDVNSTAGGGPNTRYLRNGTTFGNIGNGGQMGAGFGLDALAFVARAGNAIQMAAGGSTTPHFQITAAGVVQANGSTIWTAGNDGAGSGLDADLLDGAQGSAYALLADNEVVTGAWNFLGSLSSGTTFIIGQQFHQRGVITPAQITADQNNYNPTDLNLASILRISSDAARNITGMEGSASGRHVLLLNIGAFPIAINNENAGSAAANRFALATSIDITLSPGDSSNFWYDVTSSRWRNWNSRGN